jgi:hypothetical protein
MPRLTLNARSDRVLDHPVSRLEVVTGDLRVYPPGSHKAFTLKAGKRTKTSTRRFDPPVAGLVLHSQGGASFIADY